MNLGINNTAFKGCILLNDVDNKRHEIHPTNIRKISTTDDNRIGIEVSQRRYYPNGSCIEHETIYVRRNSDEDYDRLLRIYDIASRYNKLDLDYPDSCKS